MNLTPILQERSGLRWVLDRLEPLSPFGRAAVRALPWYGPGQETQLEEELDNVAQALCLRVENPPALRTLCRCLTQFRDIRGSLDRDADHPFDLVELFELKHFLLVLGQLIQAYAQLPAFSGINLSPMTAALELLDPSGKGLPAFSIEDASHPELAGLRQHKRMLEENIRSTDEGSRPALLEQRRLLTVKEKELELEVRAALTTRLLAEKERFLDNMDALGHLDLILAKGLLAHKYRCTRPAIHPSQQITLRGLIHPKVAAGLEARGEQFTPVDVDLTRGCTVITGANMGGKTVSLQAISLAVLLFQCGFFIFAQEAALPLFHQAELILADNGPDSGGLSSFGREVHSLNNFLRSCSEQFFFLALDEFARGTNPQEGAALARALVSHLNGLPCIAVMSTHYDGVSDPAVAHYQVAGLTREVSDDDDDDPRCRIARRMDYRLIPTSPGAPCPRDALRVCRLLNVDEKLLSLFSGNG